MHDQSQGISEEVIDEAREKLLGWKGVEKIIKIEWLGNATIEYLKAEYQGVTVDAMLSAFIKAPVNESRNPLLLWLDRMIRRFKRI